MSVGRPIEWTDEKKEKALQIIFEHIISGKSLNSLLKNADRSILPTPFTFFEWIAKDKDLANNYARIAEYRSECIFDEMLEIADTPIDGIVIETDDNGRTKERKGDMLGHRRLQVDARKWILSKMNPKKYGDKTDITTNGKEITGKYSDWTPEQIRAEIERLRDK